MSDATPPAMDPAALMREAYARGVEAWASAMEEIVGSDEFAAGSGRLLALYAQQQEAIRTASRLAAESIHLPTAEDIASLARLVANVERKVEESTESITALGGRIAEIEKSVAAVPAATIAGLEARLTSAEDTLARLEAALAARPPAATSAPAAKAASATKATAAKAEPKTATKAAGKPAAKTAPKRATRARTTAASRKAAGDD